MEIDPCPICDGRREPAFEATVLGRHPAQYVSCRTCGLLQAHRPTWLDAAYARAVVDADTGQLQRNIRVWHQVTAVATTVLPGVHRVLDVAGGHGTLARLLRDAGFDARWSDEYAENVFARGFADDGRPYDLVTAVEVMEHLTDPRRSVERWLASSQAPTFACTTELFEGDAPALDWWYYTFATGQHVSFYQRRTLDVLGERLGRRVFSAGGLHLLTTREVSPRRLALAAGRLAPVVARIGRRRLESRTWDDHHALLRAADEQSS